MRVPLRTLITGFFACAVISAGAQVDAFYNACVFAIPGEGPFLETSVTISGHSLRNRKGPVGARNSVNIQTTILQDTVVVKALKYNVQGPVFTGSVAPAFIDQQRYLLKPGRYSVRMVISDNLDAQKKPLEIHDERVLVFPSDSIFTSSIQTVESFSRVATPGPLTKSGYDLVPYNASLYTDGTNQMSFYTEVYNTDRVLGQMAPVVCRWFLENETTGETLTKYGGFKKMTAAPVNPLLASIDISDLQSGSFTLVFELRDGANHQLLRKTLPFTRKSVAADLARQKDIAEKRTLNEYFSGCSNTDTLRMFVECLWPIANNFDKDRITSVAGTRDEAIMKNYVIDFWERRAADTANPVEMWATYYQQVQQVMKLFKCGKQQGYYTERGRVFLQYGPPNQRAVQNNEPNTFPYEIWQYYRITDGVNGQFYSNRKFVFVNRNLGDDCHVLVHSDMRGEVNNYRWPFEVTRRNSMGIGNPDLDSPINPNANQPTGTEFNQFKEIYENPR